MRMGVDGPESIADHMYRMAVMALLAPRNMGVDIDRYPFLLMIDAFTEVWEILSLSEAS